MGTYMVNLQNTYMINAANKEEAEKAAFTVALSGKGVKLIGSKTEVKSAKGFTLSNADLQLSRRQKVIALLSPIRTKINSERRRLDYCDFHNVATGHSIDFPQDNRPVAKEDLLPRYVEIRVGRITTPMYKIKVATINVDFYESLPEGPGFKGEVYDLDTDKKYKIAKGTVVKEEVYKT